MADSAQHIMNTCQDNLSTVHGTNAEDGGWRVYVGWGKC